jgi:magnesium-protoporphyrin IX monomethyl ester (oxidative) cyclase
MYDIALVNMPFGDVRMPSLALTQLKYVTEQAHPGKAGVRILYLNHEFAADLGYDLYQEIALTFRHHNSGFGDWLFREIAFPASDDNAVEYLERYYNQVDPKTRRFKEFILMKRRALDSFLDGLILSHRLDKSRLVGFSSMFSQNVACLALARKIKAANPSGTIVIGGANCEAPMGIEIARHAEAVDYVFSGPALKSFPAFVGFQLSGDDQSCLAIPGVFSSQNIKSERESAAENSSGSNGETSLPPIGEELDINHPIPLDYDSFLESFERHFPKSRSGPTLTFETSRGCWWGEKAHCTFCGLNGLTMKYRAMKPELALEQFKSLFRYADRASHLQCVDNILPKSYLSEVLSKLETPAGMSIFYEVKSDLTERDVATLTKARVGSIQPGIEALATSTLKLMRKGSSSFQNIQLLKNCALYGVSPAWNLLIGFPGEGEEVYEKYLSDIPRLTHLPPPSGVFPVRFDRYSPYFVKAAAYGLDLRPYGYYGLIYPFPEEAIANLAYYFVDANIKADYFTVAMRWLGKLQKAVEEWKSRWWEGESELRPRLELRREDGQTFIYDGRSPQPLRHPISPKGEELLGRLNSQTRFETIDRHFSTDCDVSAEAEYFRQIGILFEEDGRVMSLVVPPKAPDAVESLPDVSPDSILPHLVKLESAIGSRLSPP